MRLSLTDKGLKLFSKIEARYDLLNAQSPNTAGDRIRFEYGHANGSLVDLAMGYNGSSAKSLIRDGLAEYDSAGRWEVDHMSGVINAST